MKRSWKRPRRKGFANREEVPRWFGLSVVLIYLTGLGAVAYLGIASAREQSTFDTAQAHHYAVKALSDKLSAVVPSTPLDETAAKIMNRYLREFSGRFPVRSLRVLDFQRLVVASINQDEVGLVIGEQVGFTRLGDPGRLAIPAALSTRSAPATVRVPILVRRSEPAGGTATAGASSPLFVEAEFSMASAAGSSLADYAPTLTVVLIVLGALLATYRRLRWQLRGVSRIVDRLELRSDDMERNLSSLRIADAEDHLTDSWNQLIDSAQGWADSLQRQTANDELLQVLRRGGGGSLVEALHAVPDGIIMISQDLRFEYFNAAAGRLFGWSPSDDRSYTLDEARAKGVGGAILEFIRTAHQPGGAFEPRAEMLEMPDGQDPAGRSSYRVQVFPLHRSRLEGACIVMIRDVSQQLRADRAREEFVTQVTHELRTPLTNIRAYAETLSSGMFNDPKVVTECYNVITKETRRLSRLIEDILSVSQLEVGSIELNLDTIELRTLLTDSVRDVRGLAEEKKIDLQLDLPPKLEPVKGDRDKLAVVFNNLLGNAIKYTRTGGSISVGCRFADDEVLISIKDTGVGISPDDQERVFEKFQRSSDPQVQQEQGTGIGLFTAREIVRRHGGEIDLISEPGTGSTFVVRLKHRPTRAGAKTTMPSGNSDN